jgi:hypothetical protein
LNEEALLKKSKNSSKALQKKMASALSDEMSSLSADMRKILMEDMACAFENRLKILSKAEDGINFLVKSKEIEYSNAAL